MATQAQKEARQKAASELIRLGFQNDPGSFKKMPRNRLTKANADKVFDVDIDYLRDATGTVIFPDDWMWQCLPAPFTYFIVPKLEEIHVPDAAEDSAYAGLTVVVVLDVPQQVSAADLKAWLKKGLEEEDPGLQKAIQAVEHCETQLAKTQEKMDNVPFMETKAETAKEAAEERKLVMKYLEHEKSKLEKTLETKKVVLKEAYRRKSRERITIERVRTDEKRKRSAWYAKFPGDPQRAWQAVHKESWGHVRLGQGDGESIPPVASLTELPDDYLQWEVNMRLVRVRRLKHGEGTYTYWNNEAYRGQWAEDKRHGQGALFFLEGKLEGNFENDQVRGKARVRYACGDSFDGSFACVPDSSTLPYINPERYRTGLYHGEGEMSFADGSSYSGEFMCGRITGKGKWYNPTTGELKHGTFLDGELHGRGVHVTSKGERYEGEWRHGELHHEAVFTDKNGDVYRGDFHHGVYHGKGELRYNGGEIYTGFFVDNLREGPGTMTYGNVKPEFDSRTGKTFTRFDYRYEGGWCVGKIRARNVHTTMSRGDRAQHNDDTYYFTTNAKSVGYEFLSELPEKEAKRARRKRKMYRKLRERELEARRQIEYENTIEFNAGRERALALYAKIQEEVEREKEEEEERVAEQERRRKQQLRREKLRRDLQRKRDGDSLDDGVQDTAVAAEAVKKPSVLSKFKISIADLFDDPPRKLDPRRDSTRGSGSQSSLDRYLRQRNSSTRVSGRI